MIKHQKGQSLILYGLLLVGLIALMGLAVDVGMLVYFKLHAQGAVSNACVYAANASFQKENAQNAFYQSLSANNIPTAGYQPTSGSGTGLVRGITVEAGSIRTAIRYNTPTYFMNVIGIRNMTVSAHARCSTTGSRLTPIAVKYSAWDQSYNHGDAVDILGKGAEADVDDGKNYRGAVYPFLWCVNSSTDMTPNGNCPYQQIFAPLTQSPPSGQSVKDAIETCWSGFSCNRVLSPINTRLAVVAGVSNAQLVKSATQSGLVVGVKFVAMIYNGSVTKPDPSFGNWENVVITGYALFEVTKANANTLTAKAISPIVTDINDLFYLNKTLFYPNEIPWNATTGW